MLVEYRTATGGVNLRGGVTTLNQDPQRPEFALLMNVETYQDGGLVGQQGNTQLNSAVSDTSAVLGIGEFKTGSSVIAVYVKASGSAYAMVEGGAADGTAIKTGLSTSAIPHFCQFNGKILVFNGVDQPWSYDGTTAANLTGTPSAWSSTKPNFCAVHRGGRVLTAVGSEVYYCVLGNENDWTGTGSGFLSTLYGDKSPVIGLGQFGEFSTIHTNNPAIYLLGGQAPADYTVVPIASNRAAVGSKAFANINNRQWFFTGDAIIPIEQTQLNQVQIGGDNDIGSKIKPFLYYVNNLENILPLADSTRKDTILVADFIRSQLLVYGKQLGSSTYNITAIFNFLQGAWTFRQATPVTTVARVGNTIMTGTSDGKILKEFSGENLASGALLEKKVITSWLDFGSMFSKKQLEKFYVLVDINNQSTMQVTVKQDWSRQAVQSFPVVQPVAKDVYGTATYGTATYSGSNILDHSESIEGKFRSIQLDFDLSASDTSMKLLGYGFDVKVLDANSP